MNTEENNIANNSAGVQRIVQMERTIDDLFGPSFSAASKSSFMKPPTTMKKHPINHEKESLDKPCEALKPQNTENVKPQVPFIMKPPSKKEPSLGQEKPPSTTSAFEASSNKPVFNFEKPSIAPIKPAPLPESTSISPLKPTATTLKPNSNTAPAFVVKASPFMSFKYQISLQDWFFVSMEGSLCAIGKRIDIEEVISLTILLKFIFSLFLDVEE